MSTGAATMPRSGWGTFALLSLFIVPAAIVAAVPRAFAQSVVVVPPACTADVFPLIPFVDSLRVELANSRIRCCSLAPSAEGIAAPDGLEVKIEIEPCVATANRVRVSVQGRPVARPVEREISLADVVTSARPRALALAVAELLRSIESPPAPAPEKAESTAKASASVATPVPPAPVPMSAVQIVAEGEARFFPMADTRTLGARLRLTSARGHVHADVDIGAAFARSGSALGEVALRSGSVGFSVGPRLDSGVATVDVGLRAEVGWAWVRGEPASADVRGNAGSDMISNLGLRVSLEPFRQLRVRPMVTFEGGGVLRAIKGEVSGTSVVAMNGYYLLVGLGIGAAL